MHHSSFITPPPPAFAMWLDAYVDWFVVLIAVWLASVGGVIGSFLNVVVYRLPLGMSLVHPGSRCSVCLTPIRWYDNFPVLGWFWLRGRCRACGSAISPRYPAVEGIVTSFFVLFFFSEFCFGGARDPWSAAGSILHAPWASDLSSTPVWMRYWLGVILAVTLLAAALIERDGHAVPWKLCYPTLAVSFAIPWLWRDARPLHFEFPSGPTTAVSSQFAQPLELMLGAWVALVIALLAWPRLARDSRGSRPALMALLAIGIPLGWQLTAVIGVLWLVDLWLRRPRHALPSLALIAGVTLLLWRPALACAARLASE